MSSESTRSNPFLQRLASRRRALELRAHLLQTIRAHFDGQGYLEVETPCLLTTVAPEEYIEPMECDGRYLATSPELQMKQLVAAGMGRIYQVTRSFRRGEYGRKHSPEFTILEWYRGGSSLQCLVDDLDQLMKACVKALCGGDRFEWNGHTVDVSKPLKVTSVQEAYRRYAGWDPVESWDPVHFDVDMVEKVEPNLGRGEPEALGYYPHQAAALARLWPGDRRVAQRVELYVEGLELSNGFVELSDAAEQRQRFQESSEAIRAQGRTPPPVSESFLEALPFLPDTVGMAVGVDRLAMLLTNSKLLEEVRAFDFHEA